MKNNCQDFCIALGKYLDPKISPGVFPMCEAGRNEHEQLGYASAASGAGKENKNYYSIRWLNSGIYRVGFH